MVNRHGRQGGQLYRMIQNKKEKIKGQYVIQLANTTTIILKTTIMKINNDKNNEVINLNIIS